MAWNEPGGKDPWGNRQNDQGPPDLDEILRKLQRKMGGLFGGGRGGSQPTPTASMGPLIALVIAVLVVWVAVGGFYVVDEGKRGVVTRFGAWRETAMPGPHWHWPWPIERHAIVDIEQTQSIEIGSPGLQGQGRQASLDESSMLTRDEKIMEVRLTVQYKIKDPRAYLFNVNNPEETLRDVTQSALREVIGRNVLDYVLGPGQTAVSTEISQMIQAVLDEYQTGLDLIGEVKLQKVQLPDQVQQAVADQTKAREDKQRYIFEAEAYKNDVVPKAGGRAARVLAEAEAYRERVIAQAEGETSRFLQVLAEYRKAPEVMRKRMYLETLESVMSQTGKVIVGEGAGNSLNVLPLDRMLQNSAASSGAASIHADGTNSGIALMPSASAGGGSLDGSARSSARDPESARSREGR
jgi:modulator of FtsH protease HflK